MHSANTLMSNILPYAERLQAAGRDDVILMASPMAHQTGFMYGLMMPVMLRARAVLQENVRIRESSRTHSTRGRHLYDGVDAVA